MLSIRKSSSVHSSKKLVCLLTTALLFLILYGLSMTALQDFYLFEWTARHKYIGLWAIALVLLLLGKLFLAYAVALGNLAGILTGQFLGDWLRAQSIQKITPDMNAETVYRMYHHPGVEIWLAVVALFVLASALLHLARKRSQPL